MGGTNFASAIHILVNVLRPFTRCGRDDPIAKDSRLVTNTHNRLYRRINKVESSARHLTDAALGTCVATTRRRTVPGALPGLYYAPSPTSAAELWAAQRPPGLTLRGSLKYATRWCDRSLRSISYYAL